MFTTLIEDLAEMIRYRGLENALVTGQMTEVLASPALDFVRVRAVFRALRRADIRPVWVLDEFDAGRRLFEDTPQFFHWLRELCSNPQVQGSGSDRCEAQASGRRTAGRARLRLLGERADDACTEAACRKLKSTNSSRDWMPTGCVWGRRSGRR